ncbi:TPA: hypothetical protein QDB14_001020 [Burkholderia vietnamiensis]|nr:hypothetical protein [Burkholderia vietnamiensis]
MADTATTKLSEKPRIQQWDGSELFPAVKDGKTYAGDAESFAKFVAPFAPVSEAAQASADAAELARVASEQFEQSARDHADAAQVDAAAAVVAANSAAMNATAAANAQTAGLIGFADATEMNGSLGYPAKTVAMLASDGTYWIKYGAANAGGWNPSSAVTAQSVMAALNARVTQATYRGWRIPFVDVQGKTVGGFNRYGRLILTFGGDIAARLDAYANSFASLFSVVQPSVRGSRIFAVTDKLMSKIALEVRRDGHLVSMGRDLTAGYDQLKTLLAMLFSDLSKVRSGYWIAFTDPAGRVPLGISRAGRTKLLGRDVLAEIDALRTGAVSNKYISPNINIITPGDSLTNGAGGQTTWRAQLPALLTTQGRTVTNAAVGGMTSTQVAARVGAYDVLLTVANNKLLAAGATNVTASQCISAIDGTLKTVYPMSSQSANTIRGYLNNVRGTLTRGATDDALTFTPDAGQLAADTPVPTNLPFQPIMFDGHDFDLIVTCVGRNNLTEIENIKRDFLAIRNWQKTIEKRVIVITPPNAAGEGIGTANYNNVVAIEQWAQQTFGECVVVSRQILLAYGDPNNAQDAADMAAGIVPTSLRVDAVHWTTIAHGYIASAVAAIINRKGF